MMTLRFLELKDDEKKEIIRVLSSNSKNVTFPWNLDTEDLTGGQVGNLHDGWQCNGHVDDDPTHDALPPSNASSNMSSEQDSGLSDPTKSTLNVSAAEFVPRGFVGKTPPVSQPIRILQKHESPPRMSIEHQNQPPMGYPFVTQNPHDVIPPTSLDQQQSCYQHNSSTLHQQHHQTYDQTQFGMAYNTMHNDPMTDQYNQAQMIAPAQVSQRSPGQMFPVSTQLPSSQLSPQQHTVPTQHVQYHNIPGGNSPGDADMSGTVSAPDHKYVSTPASSVTSAVERLTDAGQTKQTDASSSPGKVTFSIQFGDIDLQDVIRKSRGIDVPSPPSKLLTAESPSVKSTSATPSDVSVTPEKEAKQTTPAKTLASGAMPVVVQPAATPPQAVNKPASTTQSPQQSQTSSPQQQASSPSAPTPIPAQPKSWANLFSSSGQPQASRPTEPSPAPKKEEPLTPPRPANEIGAILSDIQLSQTAVPIQARRLINQANWCYVNSTLQALLACPPFYHMLKAVPKFPALRAGRSVTPVLDAMVEFVNQFSEMKIDRSEKTAEKGKRKRELKPGEPFEPTAVYDVLQVMKTSENTFQRGKQEDAEEFLTCLLNKLHEEIGEAIKQNDKKNTEGLANGNGDAHSDHEETDDGEDWEQVGPRNKSVVTYSNVDKLSTPISKIFGGLLRSSLSTGVGNKESATLEPFFTVPLNVQNKTIEEALHSFVSKETIDGYTCPTTKQELDAHRRLTFELLPPILIIHLKCFVYDKHGGSQKVMHNVKFHDTLDFEKDLLSSQAKCHHKDQRSYKLFAVVYHSGNKTTGGHYHTDVFHTGIRSWVRFDDNSTSPIGVQQVLDSKQPCVPYLLYYKRADMMQANHKPGANSGPQSR